MSRRAALRRAMNEAVAGVQVRPEVVEVVERLAAADQSRRMFGITKDELVAEYGADSANQRLSLGPDRLVASILSDAQELLERGRTEEARQLLNRAKWVVFDAIERKAPR